MLMIERRLEAWHVAKYPTADPAATYRKLLEEIGELGEAMMHTDSAACEEEIGDVVAVLTHLLRMTVGGRVSILDTLEAAMDKMESRAKVVGKKIAV